MLSQRSLLLLMVLGQACSLPQPFKRARLQVLPKDRISKPIPKPIQEMPNVPLETLNKDGLTGSPETPGLNPLPIINSKDSLPVPIGEISDYAATVGDKPILPKLGVPGIPDVPQLNPLPVINAEDSLLLPNGDPAIIGNNPIVPELGVPGSPEIPGLNPLPITNAKTCIQLPKEDLSVKDKAEIAELPEIPAINTQPNIIPKVNLPIAKEDLVVNVATADKPNLPGTTKFGISETSQWNDVYHRINRLEAVLKLEERIQVVGGKMMATSGKEADFATSKSKCKSVGGRIVTPKSEAENNAVLTFVKKYNRQTYLGMEEGRGNPAVYTRWGKGEPSGKGKQNCTEMYIDGQWNSKACNQKRLTVCEL
ncbi:uncharacterized protein LOC143768559 [Ranitomeya variabilis]|uniref:uncharacterized protein LOC143768559 n=1 Tax=Ranitomeya variabilis TaxID=490064 RepID=UPI00405635B9